MIKRRIAAVQLSQVESLAIVWTAVEGARALPLNEHRGFSERMRCVPCSPLDCWQEVSLAKNIFEDILVVELSTYDASDAGITTSGRDQR